MEHSEKFDLVKMYYDRHFWSKKKVHDAVDKNWITREEYKEITGEDY